MPRALFTKRYQDIITWAENTINLPLTTPRPGKLVLEPWQRGILEAYQNPEVQEVDMMMSSQIGKSLQILVILNYHIDCSPAHILFVNPGIATLKRFINEKFLPLLEACPEINRKVRRTIHKNILPDMIPFSGGCIFTAYSGSAASLRSVTAPLVIADEVDVYRGNQDTANPLSIIWQRTNQYGDRAKFVIASTPVESGASLIEASFNEGTQSYWYVPCPACNLYQPIEYDYCKKGIFYCRGCSYAIPENERKEIISEGRWEDTKENLTHKSFHYNQLYATHKSLADTMSEYREDNPRGFWTQVLGLPYRSLVEEEISEDDVRLLYAKDWIVDGEIVTDDKVTALTVSVDVQGNRLEMQVAKWKGINCRLTHKVLPFAEGSWDSAWQQLNRELYSLMPDKIFIDRHYPSPDEVNNVVSKYLSYWISAGICWLIVGLGSTNERPRDTFNKPLVHNLPTSKNPYYASLSVDTGKEIVYNLLRSKLISIDPEVPPDFYQQIVAEELRWIVTAGGIERKRWIPKRRRNEALDCAVYNLCAKESLGPIYIRSALPTWGEMEALYGSTSAA